jgi:uncharacterized caspase-like protein
MQRILVSVVGFLALMAAGVLPATAQQPEKRIALVIGNAAYAAGALPTAANDAGLIAQTLQAAGFDVVGARDLDQDSLRRAFRDFLDKAGASGPGTVAMIYLSGHGLQLEGENYFIPIDAKIARDTDVAAEAIRISDYVRPLAALKLKANIVVIDAARAYPFAQPGARLAGGLALIEPEPNTLFAFNAAPGTVAPESQGAYGAYAQALAEMIREGGVPLGNVFDQVRLRVNEVTKGAQLPWNASKVEVPFAFFERAADAPPPAVSLAQAAAARARPIREFSAQEAYIAALERDSLQGYQDFLAAYPGDPMAKRVHAILAARREAITWRRTRAVDTPPAYWSYLRRYPRGSHAFDARRRLEYLTAAFEPPPTFAPIEYDVPPPPDDEIIYVERPLLMFDDPDFGFAPPPPPPLFFLSRRSPEYVMLPPPPPPVGVYMLPSPIYRPVPVWVRAPTYVAPPPNNVIYNNIHNTVVINNTTNTVTVTRPGGQPTILTPPPAAPPRVGAPVVPVPVFGGPALPPSVAVKAATVPSQPIPPAGTPTVIPGQPGQPPRPLGPPLPGTTTQPLPPVGGRPPVTGVQPLPPVVGRPPVTGVQPLPPVVGRPPVTGVQPLPPAGGRPSVTGVQPLPPAGGKPPVIGVQPPPPATVRTPPPPAAVTRTPPPAAVVRTPPPVVRTPPPPVVRSPPPPPPVVQAPPPPVVRTPPPPVPVVRTPPPPAAARVVTPPPVKCPPDTKLVNGKCVKP